MGQAQTAVSGSETSLPNITACTLTELTDMQLEQDTKKICW